MRDIDDFKETNRLKKFKILTTFFCILIEFLVVFSLATLRFIERELELKLLNGAWIQLNRGETFNFQGESSHFADIKRQRYFSRDESKLCHEGEIVY